MLAKNIVPFGTLYLIVNAPSSIYSLTLAGKPAPMRMRACGF